MFWATQIQDFYRIRTHIRSSESFSYANLTLPFTGPAPDRQILLAAAENGHYDITASILEAGLDVNTCDSFGFTALHLACWNGHTRVAELLLKHGANVDAATCDDLPPFACALMSLQPDVLDLLLSGYGAILTAPEAVQAVALNIAIVMSNADVAKMIVELGIDVNRPLCKHFNASPLDTAVRQANFQLVDMLLQNGADVNVRSDAGLTALEVAALNGQEDIFDLLFAVYLSVYHESPSVVYGILYQAILGGSSRALETILGTGIDTRRRFPGGMSPLSLASEFGHVQQVRLLLAHGSDANASAIPSTHTSLRGHRWDHEWTSLHAAVYTGRPSGVQVVETLLQHGADVNARTAVGGYTPLNLLLERKRDAMTWPFVFYDDEIIEMLLSWGATLTERCSALLRELGSPLCDDSLDGLIIPGAWSDD